MLSANNVILSTFMLYTRALIRGDENMLLNKSQNDTTVMGSSSSKNISANCLSKTTKQYGATGVYK